jgi:hypothetical protein
MICKPKKLSFLDYFDSVDITTVVGIFVTVAVDSNTTTVAIRRRLILCVVVVDRIPTITTAIAINAIGYAVEVDTVILCNAVSIGGIICLNKYQRSPDEVTERIVLSEFEVAHLISFRLR